MTDSTPGPNTGGDAPGSPEHGNPDTFPASSRPRFAAEMPVAADAHSPASPYTTTAVSRPARAVAYADVDGVPVVGVDPVNPVGALLPVDVQPVAPVTQHVPVAPVAPEVALAPDVSQALQVSGGASEVIPVEPIPVAAPDPKPDEYIEPPLVPRPYAVATTVHPPGPPSYAPPVQSHTPPYQPYESPMPPPEGWVQTEATAPYAAPGTYEEPLFTGRPYSQPGYGAHLPVPPSAQNPPASFGSPDAGAPFGGPAVPAMATGYGAAKPRTENVGRGLLMALIAVIGGCVLSAVIYQLGFVASIGALAMGAAGMWLYAKGAGTPARKGAVPLVVLLVAGILLAWVASLATELYVLYVDRTGSSDGALVFAVTGALSLDLFTATLKDFLIFVAFGLIGIFGVARRLLPRKRN